MHIDIFRYRYLKISGKESGITNSLEYVFLPVSFILVVANWAQTSTTSARNSYSCMQEIEAKPSNRTITQPLQPARTRSTLHHGGLHVGFYR
jgi:hypothetical protein